MTSFAVIGAQWGDEGKGKIVDLLAERADVVVRYAGGNNAGHTLVVGDRKVVVHLLPSGIIHSRKTCVLGDGMVIDPAALLAEISEMKRIGIDLDSDNLCIGLRAHVVLPYHRILDGLREGGAGAIGTTKRGIGPAYEDKAARRGLRIVDLVHDDRLAKRLKDPLAQANVRIAALGGKPLDESALLAELIDHARQLRPHFTDVGQFLSQRLSDGKSILFEGAQGVLLDLDHGTYPYVTSSSTIAGGIANGAGISPRQVQFVLGVSKAYVTRVGNGPFPTELHGAEGERLRELGSEYGATTGRPRRCGWLDIPALRYAVRIGGITHLALTKLDILAALPQFRVCTAYRLNGKVLSEFPADAEDLAALEPVWQELPGLGEIPSRLDSFEALPASVQNLVKLLENAVGVPVVGISTGPRRSQTVLRESIFQG